MQVIEHRCISEDVCVNHPSVEEFEIAARIEEENTQQLIVSRDTFVYVSCLVSRPETSCGTKQATARRKANLTEGDFFCAGILRKTTKDRKISG